MLIAMDDNDFHQIIGGGSPRGLGLPDSQVAPVAVLEMLRSLASSIALDFVPAAWMFVEDGEVVGICSVVKPHADGRLEIGFGIAPTRQRKGAVSRGLAELLTWARDDDRVREVTAECSIDNTASRIVLARNGFVETGQRLDEEDGNVMCWTATTVR
ncbi:GNAT family N-acetyltransferase [Falsihalocynthiibacter sp. S25ZX9]|uniref:GNAT family N-acetyltransferase n=1 Tax=Falsihalocynthiibacter sp. S25ZX9 TaxID=3240870 RepID=UPI00350ED6A7